MDAPPPYQCFAIGDEHVIVHERRGRLRDNVFTTVWLVWMGCGCAALVGGFAYGEIPMWFLSLFAAGWLAVACHFLYTNRARTTFRLSSDALVVETSVYSVGWRLTLRRATVSSIAQVITLAREGRSPPHPRESDPGWGVVVGATSSPDSLLHWLGRLNAFGRARNEHVILADVPFEESRWLAEAVGAWARVPPRLCPDNKQA